MMAWRRPGLRYSPVAFECVVPAADDLARPRVRRADLEDEVSHVNLPRRSTPAMEGMLDALLASCQALC